MDVKKLIKELDERKTGLEEKKEKLPDNIIKTIYEVRISELQTIMALIIEWGIEEIDNEIRKLKKEV